MLASTDKLGTVKVGGGFVNMGIALFRSDPLTLSMLDTWWDVGENLTLAQQTFDEKVVPARKKDIERLGQENNARQLICRILNSHLLIQMASYEVASIVHLAQWRGP